MEPLNDIANGLPATDWLAARLLIRARVDFRVAEMMELCAKFMALQKLPGSEQIDFTELRALFQDVADYAIARVPRMACECIEATRCELCRGKQWLSIHDLMRIGATLPRKSSASLSRERETPERREQRRAAMRVWWRKNGRGWRKARLADKAQPRRNSPSASRPAETPRDGSPPPALAALFASAERFAANDGRQATDEN